MEHMSPEDWKLHKEAYKEEKRRRRESFKGGPGWTCHSETHWSCSVEGSRLDYWPGTKKWKHNGKIMIGEVQDYITARGGVDTDA